MTVTGEGGGGDAADDLFCPDAVQPVHKTTEATAAIANRLHIVSLPGGSLFFRIHLIVRQPFPDDLKQKVDIRIRTRM